MRHISIDANILFRVCPKTPESVIARRFLPQPVF